VPVSTITKEGVLLLCWDGLQGCWNHWRELAPQTVVLGSLRGRLNAWAAAVDCGRLLLVGGLSRCMPARVTRGRISWQ